MEDEEKVMAAGGRWVGVPKLRFLPSRAESSGTRRDERELNHVQAKKLSTAPANMSIKTSPASGLPRMAFLVNN